VGIPRYINIYRYNPTRGLCSPLGNLQKIMLIPPKVRELANFGLDMMRQHPQHHFDWHIRRAMYKEFKSHDLKRGQAAHGWLAVITAEFVLPIFTAANSEDDLPVRLLDIAQKIMMQQESISLEAIEQLLDEGYMGTGIDAIEWRDKVAYNAEYAGATCYKALLEASGHQDLLDNVETLKIGVYPNGNMVMSIGGTEAGATWSSGDTLSDEEIAHLAAYSDTASPAAIASSCGIDNRIIDYAKLSSFWEWWVNSALKEAWTKVE
jgi:hypothetical protein